MASKPIPNVCLLIETSTSWGRRLIRGIGEYARANGPWRLRVEPRGFDEPQSVPVGWRGDGIIARISDIAVARQIAKLNLPTINVSAIRLPSVDVPRVISDESAIARMAVAHFRERGFLHLAYCGEPDRADVDRRSGIFEDVAHAAGCKCHVFSGVRGRSWPTVESAWSSWLTSLPKPLGLAAWTMSHARRIADLCSAAGLKIPDDVAILSVGTDDLLGEFEYPTISAVELAMERWGYETAAQLDRMMHGHRPPTSTTLIQPLAVIARQSTDVLAIDDPVIAEALRFIRDNASGPLEVADVLRSVLVSRRLLEKKFKSLLGRSPAEEIRRVRIEKAKHLLARTSMRVSDIAIASGFNYPEHMVTIFRKMVGMTPLVYRRQANVGNRQEMRKSIV